MSCTCSVPPMCVPMIRFSSPRLIIIRLSMYCIPLGCSCSNLPTGSCPFTYYSCTPAPSTLPTHRFLLFSTLSTSRISRLHLKSFRRFLTTTTPQIHCLIDCHRLNLHHHHHHHHRHQTFSFSSSLPLIISLHTVTNVPFWFGSASRQTPCSGPAKHFTPKRSSYKRASVVDRLNACVLLLPSRTTKSTSLHRGALVDRICGTAPCVKA